MKRYRAAIVGCGRIASTFDDDPHRKKVASHAGAYSAVARTELVAAADIDPSRLSAFGARWGVKQLHADYREMLAKEKPDIVSVCTWPSSHFQIVVDAVQAGVKAVFCEKPITDSLATADKMVSLCDQRGVVLAVNHSRRWDAFHQEIKARLENQVIGKVQQVSTYYTAGLANTGSHLLDLLRYFFGDVTHVWATGADSHVQADPNIDGFVFFASGARATLQSMNVKNFLIFDIDIYGTSGRIRVTDSGARALKWTVVASPMFSGYSELNQTEALEPEDSAKSALVTAVEDLVDCLDTSGRPRCGGEDGRQALELICALRESTRLAAPVELPLQSREFALV